MKKLLPLKPKVKILKDFYVFDVETEVSYDVWLEQRLQKNPDFDVQANPKKPGIYFGLSPNPESFKLGVIYGDNFSKVFHSVSEMVLELQSERYKGKKVFAHNAFYDLSTLYRNIYYLDPTAIFNGSRFISCSNNNCTFADSFNIFQTSVAKIAKAMGMQKPDLGNDYYAESIDAGVINRCYEDCRIVYEALLSIFEMAGDIKITQASLSMTYFRRHHQKYVIEHNELQKHFWNSYYGGRTEAFYLGQCDCVVYDRNSSYPASMIEKKFPDPANLKLEINVKPKKFIQNILPYFEGLAYADIQHTDVWAGSLPVKRKGKLYFPIGNLSGCWNLNELRYAVEAGFVTIKNVKKVVYSEPIPSPFVGYIDYLYNARLASKDEFEKYRIKIFMNSLYGKFAQRILHENIYLDDLEKRYEVVEAAMTNGTFVKLSMFNQERMDAVLTVKSIKMKNLSYSIPSFSSYITSYARIDLHKSLMRSGEGNVVYCDTDSKFVRSDFGLKSSSKLGEWKKEGAINKLTGQWEPKRVLEVRGLKNYVYYDPESGKIKGLTKGVPANAIEVDQTSDEYLSMVRLGKIQKGKPLFHYFNLVKTKEALRRNVDIKVVKRTKIISGDYEKRIVLETGETKPIVLV